MKTRTIAFLAVAMTMGFGAIGVAACSSSSGTSSGALPGVDSSADGTSSGSSGTSSGSSGTSSGSSGTSSGSSGTSSGGTDASTSDCGKLPILIAEDSGTGPFCPFFDSGSPEAGRNCPVTESCCHPNNTDPETCNATCAVVDGGAIFECDTKNECTGGALCYMSGSVQSPTDPNCSAYLFGSKVNGTKCHAAPAGAGEVEVCSAQGECSAGTCTPFSTKGRYLGYCK